MSSLPFPVRVAAGLVVAAVEEARDLPRAVVGLPITAVSRVLQLSMRAQQVVTELAIKGDTALDGMQPVQDAPSWARFDDDFDDDLRDDHVAGDRTLASFDEDIAPRTNGHTRVRGVPSEHEAPAPVTPDALPGYETMTIAQLRGRLRSLSLDQVSELLSWETAHADRPPFVTMLRNRITTLSASS